jgi:hypothetical protein
MQRTLASPLTIRSFGFVPEVTVVGHPTELSVNVSGGNPPYSYSYLGLPPGCAPQNLSRLGCVPTATGTYSLLVSVNDSAAASRSANTTLVVVGPLLITSFVARPAIATEGENAYLVVASSGGIGPLSYGYFGLPGGCRSANLSRLSCTPAVAGRFSLTVELKDSAGDFAQANATLLVRAAPSLAPGLSPWTYVVLAIALLAPLILLAVLLRPGVRGRSESPPGGTRGSQPALGEWDSGGASRA